MGQKTPATTTQTTKVELSPEQKKIFELSFPYAEQYAQTPIQQYQGTGIAPLSQLEQQAQTGYVGTASPAAGQLAAKSAAAQGLMLDPTFMLDVANNQYLQGAAQSVANKANDSLLNTQLPAIRTGATQAGGMYSGGSSREAIAQGLAVGNTNRAVSDSIADMMFRGYNAGLSGLQGAIQSTGTVQQQQLMPYDIQAAVGGQQRAVEQAQLDEAIRQFYTQQSLPLLQAQELGALAAGMPGGAATSVATGAVPKANPLMAGLGGAMALGPMLGGGLGGAVGGGGLGLLASLLLG